MSTFALINTGVTDAFRVVWTMNFISSQLHTSRQMNKEMKGFTLEILTTNTSSLKNSYSQSTCEQFVTTIHLCSDQDEVHRDTARGFVINSMQR